MNVALATLFASLPVLTEQVPFVAVVHDPVPVAPLLHVPVTTALRTFAWLPLWTRIVTVAIQPDFPELALDRSRSPTWRTVVGGGGGGVAVMVTATVATLDAVVPSLAV